MKGKKRKLKSDRHPLEERVNDLVGRGSEGPSVQIYCWPQQYKRICASISLILLAPTI